MPNRTIQDYATTTSATGSDYLLIQNGSVYKKITKTNFFTGYLTDTLADGQILIGNASNDATAVTISGDISIDNLGAVTVSSLGGVPFATVATSGDYNDLINTPVVASAFISLTDAPNSYTGASLKYVRVNAGETALEFATFPTIPVLSGTQNYLTKWATNSTLGDSVIYDNGTNVGIGTTTPSVKLDVVSSSGNSYVNATTSAGTSYNSAFLAYTSGGAAAYIQKVGNSVVGNFTGTSIPLAGAGIISSIDNGGDYDILSIGGSVIYGITATTASPNNLGYRQDVNGFRIGRIDTIHNANTNAFEVNYGYSYFAPTAGTATAMIHAKGSTSDSSAYVAKFDNASGGAIAHMRNDGWIGLYTSTQSAKGEKLRVGSVSVFEDAIYVGNAGTAGFISFSGTNMSVLSEGTLTLWGYKNTGTTIDIKSYTFGTVAICEVNGYWGFGGVGYNNNYTINTSSNINSGGSYYVGGIAGTASASFTTVDGKTVTVTGGIITSVV